MFTGVPSTNQWCAKRKAIARADLRMPLEQHHRGVGHCTLLPLRRRFTGSISVQHLNGTPRDNVGIATRRGRSSDRNSEYEPFLLNVKNSMVPLGKRTIIVDRRKVIMRRITVKNGATTPIVVVACKSGSPPANGTKVNTVRK